MSAAAGLIAVVDDDEAVRDGLEALLESWGYETVAFPDAETFLENGLARDVTCLLLDVRLPGMDGLELVAELRRRGHYVPILMMSAHGDISTAVEAMRRGAQDFIEKPFDDEPLIRRIEGIATLEQTSEADPEARRQIDTLTPRETEVMQDVVSGHANKVIAHRLGISLKTVEMHRARVMKKTGAKTLAHLVRIAIAAGRATDQGA
ncbi:MAG: response regulator [Pseudomonadota bacterium]